MYYLLFVDDIFPVNHKIPHLQKVLFLFITLYVLYVAEFNSFAIL